MPFFPILIASKILLNSSLSSFLTVVRHSTDAVFLWTICMPLFVKFQHSFQTTIDQVTNLKSQCRKRTDPRRAFPFNNAVRELHLPAQKLNRIHIMSNDNKLGLVLEKEKNSNQHWQYLSPWRCYPLLASSQVQQRSDVHLNIS